MGLRCELYGISTEVLTLLPYKQYQEVWLIYWYWVTGLSAVHVLPFDKLSHPTLKGSRPCQFKESEEPTSLPGNAFRIIELDL